VAAQCFVELLAGGYTHRCEFHYLRGGSGIESDADDWRMENALIEAADEAGIGLTICPVLYERSGFNSFGLQPQQQSFRLDASGVWRVAQRIRALAHERVSAGLAIHSLRAASAESIAQLVRLAADVDWPIHIHAAEQTQEVDDCLAATGLRPVQWLARMNLLDSRWHLVHATHTDPEEIDAVAAAGASVVICPSTEANLGDGLTDMPRWLKAGVPISFGSDSEIARDWREELRWLELGQRLVRRERGVCAEPTTWTSPAERLFEGGLSAGSAAAGLVGSGLRVGARADLLVADPLDSALLGLPPERTLDALVFSSPVKPWRDVMVAGRWVIRDGNHPIASRAAEQFVSAMKVIWEEPVT
jgi:formimidoylglutamate deiminase